MKSLRKIFVGAAIVAGTIFAGTPIFAEENSSAGTADFSEFYGKVSQKIFAQEKEIRGNDKLVSAYLKALFERSKKWKKIPAEICENAAAELAIAYFKARALDENGEWALGNDVPAAVSLFEDISLKYAATAFGAEALFQECVLLTILHQYEWAFDCAKTIVNTYPGSERVGDALAQAYFIAESVRHGARPRKFKGRIAWLKDRKAGLRFYDELYAMSPKSEIAPRVLFQKGVFAAEIAEEWFEGERRHEAISAFEMLITLHPDSVLVPEAYLNVAAVYEALCTGPEWDQVSAKSALNYYTDFYSLFPRHEKAEFAYEKTEHLREMIAKNRNSIGDFYYVRRNNLRAAKVFYNEAITASPDSKAADYAREKIEKINRGERAPLTLIDWIFGRYPPPATKDFSDAPSNISLAKMGFQSAASPEDRSRDGDSAETSRAGTANEPAQLVDPEER